jgi:hypothetical protein
MRFDPISDATIQPTGPQDQVKKNPYRQLNATRDFAAITLLASTVPTMAKANMQIVSAAAPQSRIVRRPRK